MYGGWNEQVYKSPERQTVSTLAAAANGSYLATASTAGSQFAQVSSSGSADSLPPNVQRALTEIGSGSEVVSFPDQFLGDRG